MREKLNTIQNLNAELMSIDPHEVWSARFLLKETGLSTDDLQFPLLMDPSLTVSATSGVAFQMRMHVETSSRSATFIIDQSGVLRSARRATTFGDRPSPDQIVAELKNLDGKQEERER